MQIEMFRTDAIHVFQFGTLNSLGYLPRVTLVNKSQNNKKFQTDYTVSLTIHDEDGNVRKFRDFCILEMGKTKLIDCYQFITNINTELVFIFHLVPLRYQNQEYVTISREELWSLFTAQDHYIEFYNEAGFSAGVLYQSAPFNYNKFSSEKSTIIQAPKCYISDTINTYMQLVYTTFETEQEKIDAHLHCSLISRSGQLVSRWTETIKPLSTKLIDISEKVLHKTLNKSSEKSHEFYCFYAYSKNAILMPITIVQNLKIGTLSLEHSLPPIYYGSDIRGNQRKEALNHISNLEIFRSRGELNA